MHILLVEDDSVLAEGISQMLRGQGIFVEVVHTGADAEYVIKNQKISAMILDIGLPDMDGLEVLSRLRKNADNLPVLLLTARDTIPDRVRGFDLGADDYLIKPFSTLELVARLKAIMRRSAPGSDEIRLGHLVLDQRTKRAIVNDVSVDLSVREWSILEYLLRQESRVVSKQQIIDAILPCGEDLSLNAIEVYISRIRIKLADAKVVIRTIRGFGYMLEEQKN